MTAELEDKIIALQTLVEYQREELAALSDELYAQQKDLARMRQHMLELLDKIHALEEGGGADMGEEPPPPHY